MSIELLSEKIETRTDKRTKRQLGRIAEERFVKPAVIYREAIREYLDRNLGKSKASV